MTERTIPDAKRIRESLDIRQVAAALGIGRSGIRFHCWHPDSHSNGDADPSVAYWQKMNRLKCFVCERIAVGVIDLVMEILATDFKTAVEWIAERFDVPEVPAQKRSERNGSPRRLMSAHEEPLDLLVRSHIFSKLAVPTQILVPVFLAFSEKMGALSESPRRITISYGALRRYSGLSSPNAIRTAIGELEMLGWMRAQPGVRDGPIMKTGSYIITPYSEKIIELGHSLAIEERREIEYERTAAKERRSARLRDHRDRVRNDGA